jgi:NADH-quinone oxidoreductase subunit J
MSDSASGPVGFGLPPACPVGTSENSPGVHSWEDVRPEQTKCRRHDRTSLPCLRHSDGRATQEPSVETLGYSRPSLRDERWAVAHCTSSLGSGVSGLGSRVSDGRSTPFELGARFALVLGLLFVMATPGFAAEAVSPSPAVDISPAATRIESGGALEEAIFYVFAGIVLISAMGVVVSHSIVRTATCLLFTLGGMAAFYFLLAANFVGAVQLIVYAGGTLVLIIFGVMLTGRSMVAHFRAKWFEVAAGAVVCGLLLLGLISVLRGVGWSESAHPMVIAPTIETVGTQLLTVYLVPFEVVSVLLLVAMIGAAYLARPERK